MQQPIPERAGLGFSAMGYYTYPKLPTPTSIRLVRLQSIPARGEPIEHFTPIRLSIRAVDLDDNPIYEALSYTWGRPLTVFSSAEERDGWTENRFPVLCDGKVLLVTRNLFTYLHEWRSLCALKTHHSPHTREQAASAGLELPEEIWIDALSINQNEANEKGRQVSLMGRIYRQTRKITIWLGPEDVFTRPALDILLTLGSTPLSSAKTARHMSEAARCRVLGLPPWDSSRWWSVFAFLQRSWFRRSWVIQELALASQARMQCGKLMFRWETLVNACVNLTESGLGDTMDMWAWFEINGPKLNTPLWVEEMNPIITHSQRLDEDRHLFTTLNRRQPSYLALIVLQQVKIDGVGEPHVRQLACKSEPTMREACSRIPLSRLLNDCRGCDASDPRDKIYALLDIARGPAYQPDPKLSHEALRPIRADYHLSAIEVYLEAAWHILLSSTTLDLLSSQQLPKDGESESKVHGLPSWVPDWSTGPSTKRLANPFGPEWTASRGHRWVPPEGGLYQPFLTVEGVLVDTVAAVAETSSELRFSPTESAVLASQSGYPGFSLTRNAVVAAGLPRHYPWTEGGQEPGEVFWRTLIADTVHGKSPAPKEYHAVFYNEWVQTAKRAGSDFHSDHGLDDPEKEAEWERVWMNWGALFPEERERPLQDQAATEAVDHSVKLYENIEENMEELASSPNQEGGSADTTTASGAANMQADRFGLYRGRKKQEMGKSQIEIIFGEMVEMCIEDLEKDLGTSGHDEEGEDQPEGRTEGDINPPGLYEYGKSLIKKAIALSLDEEIGHDEQQTELTQLYSAIEELEDRATNDPTLQAALLAARRGFRRVGDSIIATHCRWLMDLSAEREQLAKAVQGLLTDEVSQQPERPGTPTGMQPISKGGEILSEADIYQNENTTETEEMAAALLTRRKKVSSGRAIFRTDENYLGNGPRSVLPGDQVWVLAGAVVPIVLRRRGNGRFTLVGEAFVHGIMRGEAFEKGSVMNKIEIE
ncbi:heterokaryon incompatibility protein-domain-containing protein [Lasiosphaeria hispida]|uniref:Heterokaryon incompatibility protein-domain-containing protein n=1 Tax=Lasiosphaeria hispida TaxID=260671 RepID=A0AAJ0MIU9_9PEZI|nr:heterokaryon incompatibility protein-domain-containing protein [Lasiosphaeria hispida]